MADLAQLIAWRDALQSARFRGTKVVETADKKVEYKSDSEMAAALADLERQINQAHSGSRITCVRIASSKGL